MSDIKLISDETPIEVKKYNSKIEQLEVGKEAFINMLRGALEAKEEPEVVEAEEVEAEA